MSKYDERREKQVAKKKRPNQGGPETHGLRERFGPSEAAVDSAYFVDSDDSPFEDVENLEGLDEE